MKVESFNLSIQNWKAKKQQFMAFSPQIQIRMEQLSAGRFLKYGLPRWLQSSGQLGGAILCTFLLSNTGKSWEMLKNIFESRETSFPIFFCFEFCWFGILTYLFWLWLLNTQNKGPSNSAVLAFPKGLFWLGLGQGGMREGHPLFAALTTISTSALSQLPLFESFGCLNLIWIGVSNLQLRSVWLRPAKLMKHVCIILNSILSWLYALWCFI